MKKINPVFVGVVAAVLLLSMSGAMLLDSDSVVYYKERRNMWKFSATLLLIMFVILTYALYKIKKKHD